MQNTKWNLKEKKSQLTSLNLDNDLLSILASRGLSKKEDILNFINAKLENLSSPKLLTDLEKATLRVVDAIKNNEKICIYGDYDVDGITSTSILLLGLTRLGAKNIDFYIPIRDEGYGLNTQALQQIKDNGTNLVITVDCGITSYKEIEYANSIGLTTIITDHHNLLNPIVPNAFAVINPKRYENKYPFNELAGVGTAFMLLWNIFDYYNRADEVFDYLDLVAIGTIADVVPLLKENRIIVKNGLKKLKNTKNLGLKLLLKRVFANKTDEYVSTDISFSISPIFNAAGRMQDAKLVVYLLISNKEKEINAIIDELLRKNSERKEIQNNIFELAKKDVEKNNTDYVIVSSSNKYHHGVIGIVAAKLVDTYYKPSIVLEEKLDEGIAVASCRSISNFDITNALQHCGELLEKFGGHTGAAGFTIKIENIEKFRKKINEYAKEHIKEEDFCKNIYIDKSINIQKISYEFYKSLELLQPFGMANPEPLFLTKNVIVENVKLIGEKKNHLSFDISQKGFSNKGAMWFFKSNLFDELKSSVFYDIVFKISVSQYKGKYYTKIITEDIKESLLKDDKFSFLKSLYETKFPLKSIFYTTIEIDNSELSYDFSFERVYIYQNNKFLAKLDYNISRLLNQLYKLYNFKFKLKICDISILENNYIVEIIITKDFDYISYKKEDKNIFNKIKQELIQDMNYDSTTKLALASLFKDNKNILLSNKNINTAISNNILTTFSMYNRKKYNKSTLLLSKDKNILNDDRLAYFTEKRYSVDCDYLILDRNTYKKDIDLTKFKKIILLDNNILELNNFISIKNTIKLDENIKKINKENIEKYGLDNIYVRYLPYYEKIKFKEKLENKEIILSDDSIYELL